VESKTELRDPSGRSAYAELPDIGLYTLAEIHFKSIAGNIMKTKNTTISIVISILLLSAFWVYAGLFPSVGSLFAIMLLLFSFVAASLVVVSKHRKPYLQGLVPRRVFLRNASVELFGIILAMILAGLFGRYAVQAATAQITHEPAKLIAGIAIALLAGTGAGLLVKRTWGRLTKA